MSNNILVLENISKSYQTKVEKIDILKDINLAVKKGDFLSIIGRSGSGKSTLLNIMGLLDKNDSGKIYIDGIDISNIDDNLKNKIKNEKLGFVFQFHFLLPEFTALENVMLPALINAYSKKEEIKDRAIELLEMVGLKERIFHKPSQLSGGEKQRVAIARALINNPAILLADEPTGNLDEETSEGIFEILKKINKENEQTIIVVTHSKELANLSNRQIDLRKGSINFLK